ncbi:replication-associated recombination protein A [Simiduia curdlanivorans]|uniref:Replication-associated recombination protein A n=1 Tax=Simiduia curdlanivorans TaxID=1492769 RepID=A0ABV8V2M9_9GAMM|nr:replication-associated recombination protein A [Simiduia curdlanivorans]MDN3639946.1 replication-associated recombination protein A [Simiduia curdlanivorans]
MTKDLFHSDKRVYQPLAARLRANNLAQYVGQEHLLGPGKPLREILSSGQIHSMIFWGPPGVGKTTLAKLLADQVDAHFFTLSAVMAGVKDIRNVVEQAKQLAQVQNKKSLLFVDEVHRFNKSQQDAFLPYVEDGTFIFVGATTENPSFELNSALLSRCRVYLLKPLEKPALLALLERALSDKELGLGKLNLSLDDALKDSLCEVADGDARRLLNLIEISADLAEEQADGQHTLSASALADVLRSDVRRFDKGGEQFYDQISAMHKSVRGSSADGALYWFARMIDGGCDPLYVARRVVRMASEDIGNADPRGLDLALAAWDVQTRLGSPEGELAIAQALVYLACAPKSNAVYKAFNKAMADVKADPSFEVPLHLRNAPTKLMADNGFGAEYRYAHDEPDAYAAGENYLPQAIAARRYYTPSNRGLEIKIAEKLQRLKELDQASKHKRWPELKL